MHQSKDQTKFLIEYSLYLFLYKSVSQQQKFILQLIYDDLASRHQERILNKQNFFLFFNKKGYWGDRLFEKFAGSHSALSFEAFLRGIDQIFQTRTQQKISFLFRFFQQRNESGQRGLRFDDLLLVLYNYPKDQLLKVIKQQKELLNECIRCKEPKRISSITNIPQYDNSVKYQVQSDSESSVDRIPTIFGFQSILNNIDQNKQPQNLDLIVNGKNIRLQTKKFHTLVRCFATQIFNQYHLKVKSDRFLQQHFSDWIKRHKKLYDVYFSGFHSNIWQYDLQQKNEKQNEHIPKYISFPHDIESQVIYGNSSYLILIDSTLIVVKDVNHNIPQEIINLQGLNVLPIHHQKSGYGISISHRNQKYGVKKIYFKDKNIREQWMKHLKYFKGVNITEKYQFGKNLGGGQFSVVYEGKNKLNGKKYAIKVIKIEKNYKDEIEKIMNQSQTMKQFDSPLLIKYIQTIQAKKQIYIITQLVENGLQISKLIENKNRPLDEFVAANITRQIILGLKHMHKVGYIHADLKPQNVMVIPNPSDVLMYQVKIIDFGLSININSKRNSLIAGTPGYIPAQTLQDNIVSLKNDSFALGGLIYYMLTGSIPFSNCGPKCNRVQIQNRILDDALVFQEQKWKKISSSAQQIVRELTKFDYKTRLSVKDAIKHKWFSETYIKKNQDNG